MLQRSKLLRSRDEWKHKAIQRGEEWREQRKTQKRHLHQIAELKTQLKELEANNKEKK